MQQTNTKQTDSKESLRARHPHPYTERPGRARWDWFTNMDSELTQVSFIQANSSSQPIHSSSQQTVSSWQPIRGFCLLLAGVLGVGPTCEDPRTRHPNSDLWFSGKVGGSGTRNLWQHLAGTDNSCLLCTGPVGPQMLQSPTVSMMRRSNITPMLLLTCL